MKKTIFLLSILILALSACNLNYANRTLAPLSTDTAVQEAATPTTAGTDTTVPQPTDTAMTATNPPPSAATPAAQSDPGSANYIDDRSTPSQVIVSFYNAINRHEYARAYSYWSTPAGTLGDFNTWQNGYAHTDSVQLAFGQITGDAGMSQIYYTVPVLVKATENGSAHSTYAACYIVHETNPAVFGAPPVEPMSINKGEAKLATAGASDSAALVNACAGFPSGSGPISAGVMSLNIDKTNFIDNRSGPIETVSSLFNAINRQEYVRAYSYFQDPQTVPGPYSGFEATYTGTEISQASFGTVTTEGAAGSTYYKVPVVINALVHASPQKLSGCFTLRLSNPGIQAAPPFQPMGIISGTLVPANANADVNALLANACQ